MQTRRSTGISYGDRIDIRGAEGRVISRGDNQTGNVTVETRNGVYTTTPYDRAFRSRLSSPRLDVDPGPQSLRELTRLRSRGY